MFKSTKRNVDEVTLLGGDFKCSYSTHEKFRSSDPTTEWKKGRYIELRKSQGCIYIIKKNSKVWCEILAQQESLRKPGFSSIPTEVIYFYSLSRRSTFSILKLKSLGWYLFTGLPWNTVTIYFIVDTFPPLCLSVIL